jgi:hypothetical protein
MKIHLYQIIVVAVSVFMIYQGISRFLKGTPGQTFLKLLVRIIIWGGMAMIAIIPSFTNVLANIVGLQGNINAVILIGFILIFLMIFKLLSAIERLEQNISELTRKESLKDVKEKE